VNGTVKDDKGNPVSGAFVVAEGTNTSAVTDANGKFTMGPIQASLIPVIKNRLAAAHIRVDAQGKFIRETGSLAHQVYFFPAKGSANGKAAGPKASAKTASGQAAVTNANLLISHDGQFSEVAGIDANSSAALDLTMDLISEFAKINPVVPQLGDVQVLLFNDSVIQAVDLASHEYPVCKGGKVTYLPDTTLLAYKIKGKTMYQWDPTDFDTSSMVTPMFTSKTGAVVGEWYYSGLGQIPVPLPDGMDQAEVDQALAMQREVFKVSGTTTLGKTVIHNDVQFGVCIGPLMASSMNEGPMTATSKSCTEVELKNGTETATWTFVTNKTKTTNTFKYKDATCVSESSMFDDPVYDCKGQPDGTIPEDTTSTEPGTELADCQAYVSFLLGGITIPGGLPGAKISANQMSKQPDLLRVNPAFLVGKLKSRFRIR
jgi:hypothetical protein